MFGVFCRRWGVPLIDGGTVRLPRIVGMGRALDMILTGRPVGAREALADGPRQPRRRRRRLRAQEAERWRAKSPPSRNSACSPTAPPPIGNGICRSPRRCARRAATARRSSRAEGAAGAKRFVAGAGRGGRFEEH